MDKELLASKLPKQEKVTASETYLVGFPDVLEIQVLGRPEVSGQCTIGADGRIDLGLYQKIRVEGRTVAEIGRLIAHQASMPADHVQIRVLEYQSQPLFLLGQVTGWQRTVPYQGQETVLEVLQRVGGITPGAAPEEVYVVRSHLSEGQRPEVFHVDLNAIVINKDERTNIRVLAFDQIYVGESRQAKILKCVPPWLKPMFLAMWGPRPSRPDIHSLSLHRGSHHKQTEEPEEAEPLPRPAEPSISPLPAAEDSLEIQPKLPADPQD